MSFLICVSIIYPFSFPQRSGSLVGLFIDLTLPILNVAGLQVRAALFWSLLTPEATPEQCRWSNLEHLSLSFSPTSQEFSVIFTSTEINELHTVGLRRQKNKREGKSAAQLRFSCGNVKKKKRTSFDLNDHWFKAWHWFWTNLNIRERSDVGQGQRRRVAAAILHQAN